MPETGNCKTLPQYPRRSEDLLSTAITTLEPESPFAVFPEILPGEPSHNPEIHCRGFQ